ncbi:MAG: hypothetical protein RR400_00165 [Clostridia bacterium]
MFDGIKNLFKKSIKMNDKDAAAVFVPLSSSQTKFPVGGKIEVPPMFNLAIIYHGKLYDKLPAGTHYASAVSIPMLWNSQKFFEPTNNGKILKSFMAQGVFFSKDNALVLEISNYRKIGFAEDLTKFNVNFKTKITFKILDEDVLLRLLLKTYQTIKSHDAENLICEFMTEVLTEKFAKTAFSFDQLKNVGPDVTSFFNTAATNILKDFGLQMENLELSLAIANIKARAAIKTGNTKIKTSKKTRRLLESIEINNSQNASILMYEDEIEKQKSNSQQKNVTNNAKFVDLNPLHLYDNNNSCIVCPVCKAKNRKDSLFCYQCNAVIKKGEENEIQ